MTDTDKLEDSLVSATRLLRVDRLPGLGRTQLRGPVGFALVVDMIHIVVMGTPLYPVLGVVEGGGEMLVVSVIVALAFAAPCGHTATGGSDERRLETV